VQFPWQTTLGANLAGRQGYPIPYYYRFGARRVLVEDLGAKRLPNMMELDLRLAKAFKFGPMGFELAAEGFNITNNRTILQRNNRLYKSANTSNCSAKDASGNPLPPNLCTVGPGNATDEIMSPRIFRLAAKLSF
jgi:hypothetical protein